MIGHKCRDCLWWDNQHKRVKLQSDDSDHGFCRKHKPVIFSCNNIYYGGWPLVEKNDFCGEFRKEGDK